MHIFTGETDMWTLIRSVGKGIYDRSKHDKTVMTNKHYGVIPMRDWIKECMKPTYSTSVPIWEVDYVGWDIFGYANRHSFIDSKSDVFCCCKTLYFDFEPSNYEVSSLTDIQLVDVGLFPDAVREQIKIHTSWFAGENGIPYCVILAEGFRNHGYRLTFLYTIPWSYVLTVFAEDNTDNLGISIYRPEQMFLSKVSYDRWVDDCVKYQLLHGLSTVEDYNLQGNYEFLDKPVSVYNLPTVLLQYTTPDLTGLDLANYFAKNNIIDANIEFVSIEGQKKGKITCTIQMDIKELMQYCDV